MKRLQCITRILSLGFLMMILGICTLLFLTSCRDKSAMNNHPAAQAVIRFFNAWENQDWDSMKDLLLDDDSQKIDDFTDRLRSSVIRGKLIRILDLKFEENESAKIKIEAEVTDLASVCGACYVMSVAKLISLEAIDANSESLEFQSLRKAFSPKRCGFESFMKIKELIFVVKQNNQWKLDIQNRSIPIFKYTSVGSTLGNTAEDATRNVMRSVGVGRLSKNIEMGNVYLGITLEIHELAKTLGMSQKRIDKALKEGEKKLKASSWTRESILRVLKDLQNSPP